VEGGKGILLLENRAAVGCQLLAAFITLQIIKYLLHIHTHTHTLRSMQVSMQVLETAVDLRYWVWVGGCVCE
jgi:hypothetical protein